MTNEHRLVSGNQWKGVLGVEDEIELLFFFSVWGTSHWPHMMVGGLPHRHFPDPALIPIAEGTQPAWLPVQQDKLMGGIQGQHFPQEVVGIHQNPAAMLPQVPQHDADFHLTKHTHNLDSNNGRWNLTKHQAPLQA
jgi:hypothetical protein